MGNQKITIGVDIIGKTKIENLSEITEVAKKMQQEFNKIGLKPGVTAGAKKGLVELEKELEKYSQLSTEALSGKNVVGALNTSKRNIISILTSIQSEYKKIGKEDLLGSPEQIKRIAILQDGVKDLKAQLNNLGVKSTDQFGDFKKLEDILNELVDGALPKGREKIKGFLEAWRSGDTEKATQTLEELDKYLNRFAKGENGNALKTFVSILREEFSKFKTETNGLNQAIDNTQAEIDSLSDQSFEDLEAAVGDVNAVFPQLIKLLQQVNDNTLGTSKDVSNAAKEFSNLESRIKQFFSLTNGFVLFRRAVQGAFNTVKELDAVMTETAVVTDFSVSDMWDKLPEYTKMANELGATTKGAYETATLYYQQGLKTNEVMAVSAETMKMARIAGLDYATATDYMTAALRGFNMEINEDSAQRVNDVYSRLAAITASNTQEISVAMTKVASLAHNANMEFETTAAFLAQIIETTRESAETAGTALKTVVARFTEVKKLYNEGELMGTDEEGEEIDVNKVATALRSAGIDMNKYFTGLVGLDDIFMELASKWDSLDKVQQRYIATMAAGSRQQSRFIAMMSNYQRTLELVDEAQNSAGAGQKQFDKTMESLEAKLNRLKNAWDSFLMGLANSDIIKGAVDWLTDFITKLNDFINGLSNGNGVLKTFVTLITSLAGMKIGGSLITGMTGILAGFLGKGGKGDEGDKEKKTKEIIRLFDWKAILTEGNKRTIATDLLGEGGLVDRVKKQIGEIKDKVAGFIPGLERIAAYLAPAGPYIAGLLAILAIVKLIKFASEQQKHLAENLRTEAANLKEEIDNVKETISNLNSQEEAIKGMTKGTLEWRLAVQKLNEEYEELLEKNPEYKEFILQDKYGNYYVDKEKEAAWEQKKESQVTYKLNRADQVDVEQAQKAYEKALSKTKINLNFHSPTALSSEQVEGIVEALNTGQIYNEQSWQEYQKENNLHTSLSFKDLNSVTQDTTTALHNFMEALDTYAQKMGFNTVSEEGYNEAKEATKKQIGAAIEGMSRDELFAYAEQNGVDMESAIWSHYNSAGGESALGPWESFRETITPKEIQDIIVNALANGSELDIGSALNLTDQGYYTTRWNLTGDDLTSTELDAALVDIKQESKVLGTDKTEAAIEAQTKVNEAEEHYLQLQKEAEEATGAVKDTLEKKAEIAKKEYEEKKKEQAILLENLNTEAKIGIIQKQNMKALKAELENIKKEEISQEDADKIGAIFGFDPGQLDNSVILEYWDEIQAYANGATGALNSFFEAIGQPYELKITAVDDLGNLITHINDADIGAQNLVDDLVAAGTFKVETVTLKDDTEITIPYVKNLASVAAGEDPIVDYKTIKGKAGKTYQVLVQNDAPEIPSGGNSSAPSSPSGGGGGGGGGNSNPDRWLNPYDKFYNLTEQINEALRQREKLERNYDRILKNRWSKQRDIQANTQARLNSLKQEIAMNRALLAGRQSQVDAVLNEKFLDDDKNIRTFREFGVGRYANYNTERGTIEIDWEGLERLSGTTDTQLGGVIEDYVSRLEELQKQFEDVDKTIEDLEDEVAEILDINKEEYLSFEQRVFDAIIDRQQKLIDNYSELSDTISNNDEEVLNALSESIDLSRQIRDNTKTEEEIAQKEARLAYLRRDTSGANDLAIKQLEKELEEARQSYGDTLVDQELDRLSQASEEAAKQRERQIEIMEKQLEWQQRVGFFWPEVIDLLQNNYGELDEGISDALMDLLKNTDGFRGMSEYQQANWAQELHEQWLQSESGLASWRLSEAKAASLGKEGNESNYSIAANQTTAGKALRYDYNRDMWMDEDEGWYTGVSYDATSNQFTYEGYSSKASRDEEEAKKTAAAQAAQAKRNVTVGSYINASGAPIYTSAYGGSPLHQYFADDPKYLVLDDYGSSWMVRWHGLSSGITGFFRKGDVRAYKTGGLVDYTGPAWLDGTPQRPEFVLNADQTQAFMKLVDKLGSGAGAGDNYFDINIVVDELSSDYDVDQMVDRIKQKITEDAQYRNVNAINWIR